MNRTTTSLARALLLAALSSHAPAIAGGCGPITLQPPVLPKAALGLPYDATLTAIGGTAPYTFAVTSGSLPQGLALSGSGGFSGATAVAGLSTFTVTATDSASCSGSRVYSVRVYPPVDYVLGLGFGQPNLNRVRVHDGDGAATSVDFLAYAAGQWGVNVSSGNIGSDTFVHIVTGPGPGAVFGPQVKAFDRTGATIAKVNFYAYGTLKYGVNVASGNLDSDAFDEILTGAGPGAVFGPTVRGWNVDGGSVSTISKVNFWALTTQSFGVNVEEGDIDGDTFDEIVVGTGPGPTFHSHVRAFDYDGNAVANISKININAFALWVLYGARIAAGDVDADGYDEIVCTIGPDPAWYAIYDGFDYDGAAIAPLVGFIRTPYNTRYGGTIGTGDVDFDSIDDLIAGSGPDPAAFSTVKAFVYIGTLLSPLPQFTPFGTEQYGVNVNGGALGY